MFRTDAFSNLFSFFSQAFYAARLRAHATRQESESPVDDCCSPPTFEPSPAFASPHVPSQDALCGAREREAAETGSFSVPGQLRLENLFSRPCGAPAQH